jgi:hypothetical protein
VMTRTVTFEPFQAIPRRDAQIVQFLCCIKHPQPSRLMSPAVG